MSEKMYAWLLRLYPSRFRNAYGDEALQLFRDRARAERGVFPRCRFWLDMLFDLTVSLPREHRRAGPALIAASLQHSRDGVPSFCVLENERLRPGALLFGGVLALAVFNAVPILMNHGGDRRPVRFAVIETQPSNHAPSSAYGDPAEDPGSDTVEATDGGDAISGGVGGNSLPAKTPLLPDRSAVHRGQAQQPKPEDATSAMIRLFHDHDIVMFGEVHGGKQEYEWLCKLVSAPGFADRVDDVVVEFGNPLYQKSVDRYVAGEDVPIEEVQKAWRNMIASVPPVSPVYASFYRAVREANLEHRGEHQIRLLMGGPPGDWGKIRNSTDLARYEADRERWYAQVVKDEVLAKHHHALLIMGAGHFLRGNAQALQDELLAQQHRSMPPVDRAQLGPGYIERELRAAGANPYLVVFGTNVIDNQGDTEKRFDAWPVPAIVSLSGNWVGELPAQPVLSGGHAPVTSLKLADQADAMLYVAPCSSLRDAYVPRVEVDGTAYGKEIARRNVIELGHPVELQYGEVPSCVQPQ